MNVLWLGVLWQEECETQSQETYEEYQNIEDIMKEICKEYEDKDGGGSVQEISRLMKIFKDRWWKFVMKSLEANILSEDMMKMSSKANINSKKNIPLTSLR